MVPPFPPKTYILPSAPRPGLQTSKAGSRGGNFLTLSWMIDDVCVEQRQLHVCARSIVLITLHLPHENWVEVLHS